MFVKVLGKLNLRRTPFMNQPAYSFPSRAYTGRQKKGRREGGAWLLALSRIQTSSFLLKTPISQCWQSSLLDDSRWPTKKCHGTVVCGGPDFADNLGIDILFDTVLVLCGLTEDMLNHELCSMLSLKRCSASCKRIRLQTYSH